MTSFHSFINNIICGNNIDILQKFPNECIDLVVTSPPYDNMRDYNGYAFDWNIFINLIDELYRVLKEGGVIVWVVKDAVKDGNRSLTSFKQCIAFQDAGFKIYDVLIFGKNASSLPHTNRYFDTHEYMFVISKGIPKTVNVIQDRVNKCKGDMTRGTRTVREKEGHLSNKGKKEVGKYSRRFSIWYYNIGYGNSTRDDIAFEHPATFPEQLVQDHIYSWSQEGDVVLDPFCGSGTTCKMAWRMRRTFIGIDISEEYCKIARERVGTYKRVKRPPIEYWDKVYNPKKYFEKKKTKGLGKFF